MEQGKEQQRNETLGADKCTSALPFDRFLPQRVQSRRGIWCPRVGAAGQTAGHTSPATSTVRCQHRSTEPRPPVCPPSTGTLRFHRERHVSRLAKAASAQRERETNRALFCQEHSVMETSQKHGRAARRTLLARRSLLCFSLRAFLCTEITR